jgi:hypothetical protein
VELDGNILEVGLTVRPGEQAHVFQIVGAADRDMLEAYSTLAYLAGMTSRISLGRAGHQGYVLTPGRAGQDGHQVRAALLRGRAA